jgi:hypothetical protein
MVYQGFRVEKLRSAWGWRQRRESSEESVILEGCVWLTLYFMRPILAYPGPGMAHLLILSARRESDLVVRQVNWKYTYQFLPCNLAVQCVWLLPVDERQRRLTDKWFESERVKSQDLTSIELLTHWKTSELVPCKRTNCGNNQNYQINTIDFASAVAVAQETTQQYQKGEARKIYGCRAIILLCFVITGPGEQVLTRESEVTASVAQSQGLRNNI